MPPTNSACWIRIFVGQRLRIKSHPFRFSHEAGWRWMRQHLEEDIPAGSVCAINAGWGGNIDGAFQRVFGLHARSKIRLNGETERGSNRKTPPAAFGDD